MAPIVPIQSLALVDISSRLQQIMTKNRANLEKEGVWEYMLLVRDVERVFDGKIIQFVSTYQLKTKTTKVNMITMDFSTSVIGQLFSLPNWGLVADNLPDITWAEAEEDFEYKIQWEKETRWGIGPTRHHWKMWFDFVNNYFCLDLKKGRWSRNTW